MRSPLVILRRISLRLNLAVVTAAKSWLFFLPGSVFAIYGAERNDGKFTVEDFCTADLPQQMPRPALDSDRSAKKKKTDTKHCKNESQSLILTVACICRQPGLCCWCQDLALVAVTQTACWGYSCWLTWWLVSLATRASKAEPQPFPGCYWPETSWATTLKTKTLRQRWNRFNCCACSFMHIYFLLLSFLRKWKVEKKQI